MAKESYTLAHVSITYAPFGAASFDCKNGIAESGCSIAMSEDFGERVKGGDGSSMWTEYCSQDGTITLNVNPYSPAYAFFVALQNAQRMSGTKGRDTMTILNRDLNEMISCAQCAIQSISGETYDKSGATVRVVTINSGTITRMSA